MNERHTSPDTVNTSEYVPLAGGTVFALREDYTPRDPTFLRAIQRKEKVYYIVGNVDTGRKRVPSLLPASVSAETLHRQGDLKKIVERHVNLVFSCEKTKTNACIASSTSFVSST